MWPTAPRPWPTAAGAGHGLRLPRGRAGAIGSTLLAREARAVPAVRADQLLADGAGPWPTVVSALREAPEPGACPVVEYGPVGTGDITALSQVDLAPASLGHAVRSRGVEEQAGPAALAARRAPRAGDASGHVAGREPGASVRALRRCDPRFDPALPVGRAPSRSRTPRSIPDTWSARSPMM
ncbi:hypothetical protein [Streptomyces enissocaesilis]|uniref:Uncharacterized protein n=1 Tax=Streptomyces enissocaesilis TaxID=332589 RepID=A0ABN3XFE4_9ACTN